MREVIFMKAEMYIPLLDGGTDGVRFEVKTHKNVDKRKRVYL